MLISGNMLYHSAFTGSPTIPKKVRLGTPGNCHCVQTPNRNKWGRQDADAHSPDEWSHPKPAVQILRTRSKCAVVTEGISLRRKLLSGGVSASEAPVGAPVQVSAADSWGFPDIDLWVFFLLLIRALSSTYYSHSVRLARSGGGERSRGRTHISVPHRICCTLMYWQLHRRRRHRHRSPIRFLYPGKCDVISEFQ